LSGERDLGTAVTVRARLLPSANAADRHFETVTSRTIEVFGDAF
jgi:hypothetical protein